VEKELADEMTKKLKEKLLTFTELVFVSSSRVDSILQGSVSCDEPCRVENGNALGAHIVLGGLVYKDPDAYMMDVKITSVNTGTSIYSMSYKCPCTLTELLNMVPDSAAVDIIKQIQKSPSADSAPENNIEQEENSSKSVAEKKQHSIEITLENKPDIDDDDDDDDDREAQEESRIKEPSALDLYNGAAEKPLIGISGRWALGDIRNTESQWGAELHGVIPVSRVSHLRLRAAMPASRSSSTTKGSDVKAPDILSALEHEWCYRNIGLVFGVSHMYMVPFEKTVSNRAYNSEAWNAYNWVLGIRAGRHHKGFRFRISYPMPFVEDYVDMDNYFMEINAFGMYGTEKFKAGAGASAFYKKRSSENNSGKKIISEDYFVLAPCGKVSFMVANQSVISIGLDLTGIFLPSSETGIFWSPNLMLSYVFSFGDLKNPETFDGRF